MSKGQIAVISLVGAIFIALSVILVTKTGKEDMSDIVEFTPPPFEEDVRQGKPEMSADMQYSQVDIAGNYSVALCAKARYENGELILYFTSDNSNEVLLRAIVLDKDGNELGASGLIRPGEYLSSISLVSAPVDTNVIVKVISYEFDTYYSMGTAPITVGVTMAQ